MVRPIKCSVGFVLIVDPGYRSGTVESKLRQLVMKLEYVESLVIAHPFIKGFAQEVYCLTDEEIRAVAEGEISAALLKRTKEDCDGKEGRVVYTTTFYIGLAVEPKQRETSVCSFSGNLLYPYLSLAGQQGPRKLDISYPTNEFVKMVKTWDKYDNATMGVVVQNIRRYAFPAQQLTFPGADVISSSLLPDHVFDPGEKQKSGLKRPNPKVSHLISMPPCFAEGCCDIRELGRRKKDHQTCQTSEESRDRNDCSQVHFLPRSNLITFAIGLHNIHRRIRRLAPFKQFLRNLYPMAMV